MFKFHILIISFLIISKFLNIKTAEDSIDLSDDNPVVYCLKAAKRFTFDEIKDYYLRTQRPDLSPNYQLDDPQFLWCVEEAARED